MVFTTYSMVVPKGNIRGKGRGASTCAAAVEASNPSLSQTSRAPTRMWNKTMNWLPHREAFLTGGRAHASKTPHGLGVPLDADTGKYTRGRVGIVALPQYSHTDNGAHALGPKRDNTACTQAINPVHPLESVSATPASLSKRLMTDD